MPATRQAPEPETTGGGRHATNHTVSGGDVPHGISLDGLCARGVRITAYQRQFRRRRRHHDAAVHRQRRPRGHTTEPGEPSDFCMYSSTRTAWYAFTPSDSGTARIDLMGSDFSVIVAAYHSAGGGIGDLSLVGCSGTGISTPLPVPVTAGSTYYLQVGVLPDSPATWSSGSRWCAAGQRQLRRCRGPVRRAGHRDRGPDGRDDRARRTDARRHALIGSAWYSYTPAASGSHLVRREPYTTRCWPCTAGPRWAT